MNVLPRAHRVVVFCGTTASGKSKWAFDLAGQVASEIINFDSVQVYKYMDIGTAKPTQEMRIHIPHHLIDIVEPDEIFTAGDFRRQALKVLEDVSVRKEISFLVGGTGFYLQALLKGMHEAQPIPDEIKTKLVADLNLYGLDELHQQLQQSDPLTAAKVHPHDQYRILRALEIIRSGQGRPSQSRETFRPQSFPYLVTQIGLRQPRERLLLRVQARTCEMLRQGLIEETEDLLKKYPEKPRALQSVGYREAELYLTGILKKDQLEEEIVKSTMALAKRQVTWFKRDSSIHWFDPEEEGQRLMAFFMAMNDKNV